MPAKKSVRGISNFNKNVKYPNLVKIVIISQVFSNLYMLDIHSTLKLDFHEKCRKLINKSKTGHDSE